MSKIMFIILTVTLFMNACGRENNNHSTFKSQTVQPKKDTGDGKLEVPAGYVKNG